jgi:hypothetical protein
MFCVNANNIAQGGEEGGIGAGYRGGGNIYIYTRERKGKGKGCMHNCMYCSTNLILPCNCKILGEQISSLTPRQLASST